MKRNRFRQLLGEVFSLTRSERNGMLFLGGLLLLSVILNLTAGHLHPGGSSFPDEARLLLERLSPEEIETASPGAPLFVFDPNTISPEELDLLPLPAQIRHNLLRYRSKGGHFRTPRDLGKLYGMNDSLLALLLPYMKIPGASGEYRTFPGNGARRSAEFPARKGEERATAEREFFPFNPSLASDDELKRLGFSAYQRRNLINYRSRGGKFRRPEDLLKIYGIDTLFYRELETYILIPPAGSLTTHVLVELNHADSALLTTLPGIAPYMAGRIVRYRTLLGGFHHPGQLMEVYGMTEEKVAGAGEWLRADTALVTPLRINFADTRTLARHPYISQELASAIINFRSASGPFHTPRQLLENRITDTLTYARLRPYITCN